jgi:hypothetical protein
MVSFSRPLLLPQALFLSGSALFAQGQVWHVASGGGADFTTIQAAVDAASDGDTIVVANGSYPAGFLVDAKSLTITAAAGVAVQSGGITVRNLGPTQSVAIRRIGSTGVSSTSGAVLLNNQGPVWLEDLALGFSFPLPFFPPVVGLDVSGCADVVLARCTVSSTGPFSFGADGNPGLRASASGIHLFECTVQGASLGQGAYWDGVLPDGATRGGPGAELSDSFLVASGSTFRGGIGPDGGLCSAGGPGGYGLISGVGSEAWLLDTLLVGGEGGCGLDIFCPCAPSGAPSLLTGGSISLLSGHGRDYTLSSPVAGGGTFELDFSGVPGDLVFSLVSLGQAPSFQPALGGTLVLPVPPILVAHGRVDALTGILPPVALSAPVLPPGVGALTVYAQGAAVTAVGAAVLCAPSQLTILGP